MSMFRNQKTPTKPDMSFPDAEKAWVKEHYQDARVILEYGSGGSTVFGGEMLGSRIFSVESDANWLANLSAWFEENPPLADVRLHHADIGPTKEWGNPRSDTAWRKFPDYPIGVWDRDDFEQPDLVLIDGRFRAACFVTAMFRSTKPITVLFDDYVNRSKYHIVEDYVKPYETRGRMARFEVHPLSFPVADLGKIVKLFGVIQ